jgi:hypothetical protein
MRFAILILASGICVGATGSEQSSADYAIRSNRARCGPLRSTCFYLIPYVDFLLWVRKTLMSACRCRP